MTTIPLPVWTHGTDPEGAEYYFCPDPADPAMRVTVSSLAVYGRHRWHCDYVGAREWWWERERRWSIAGGATAHEALREGTLFLYGKTRFGEWVWRTLVESGGVPTQASPVVAPGPAPEIRPPTG